MLINLNIKVLVTMHLYDDQEPDKDPLFKDGGWRRAIILARADYCPEVMIMGYFPGVQFVSRIGRTWS